MRIISSGPDWASIMTAVGTLVLAVVTVGTIMITIVITKQDRHRADKQLTDSQARHDKEIAEERALANKRLADQLAHSDAQLADERAHAAEQLRKERQLAQDLEQRGEAYAVVVTPAKIPARLADPGIIAEVSEGDECPVAVIVNRGRFAITDLETQFARDSALYPSLQMEYYSDYPTLPQELVSGLVADPGINILSPGFAGIRFIGGAMSSHDLHGVKPIIRWTDRWGTRWEHKQGQVRQITAQEPWKP